MGGRVAERNWLVVGASGGVGAAVLERLAATADAVQALSRAARTSTPSRGVRWHVGDLNTANPAEVGSPTHVVSAGPLDAFAGYLAKAEWPPGTVVVALSSMSASTKAAGGHRSEREVARRLLDAEQALFARAGHRAWPVVVLRPTLIWGAGDRSITPLLALARRTGALPLPRGATGLRQPVHVADLAQALVRAAQNPDIGPGPWPAPGGEVLAFDEMLARALAVACRKRVCYECPMVPAGCSRHCCCDCRAGSGGSRASRIAPAATWMSALRPCGRDLESSRADSTRTRPASRRSRGPGAVPHPERGCGACPHAATQQPNCPGTPYATALPTRESHT